MSLVRPGVGHVQLIFFPFLAPWGEASPSFVLQPKSFQGSSELRSEGDRTPPPHGADILERPDRQETR